MNKRFETTRVALRPYDTAPDGSTVRSLLSLAGGGMAHFELACGHVSTAVLHRSVEEIWLFLSGEGEMWRSQNGREEVVPVASGVCITLPLGTCFQFRCHGPEPLTAVGITMPPWPGDDEATVVEGKWQPTLP